MFSCTCSMFGLKKLCAVQVYAKLGMFQGSKIRHFIRASQYKADDWATMSVSRARYPRL